MVPVVGHGDPDFSLALRSHLQHIDCLILESFRAFAQGQLILFSVQRIGCAQQFLANLVPGAHERVGIVLA